MNFTAIFLGVLAWKWNQVSSRGREVRFLVVGGMVGYEEQHTNDEVMTLPNVSVLTKTYGILYHE